MTNASQNARQLIRDCEVGKACAICKTLTKLADEVERLRAERDMAREERDTYRRAIVTADSYANGRWDEWGSRALDVQDILMNALSTTEEPR